MFYIILDNSVMQSNNKELLEEYGKSAKLLPNDYKAGKYIVENDELVINPDWEKEQQQKERQRLDNLFMTRSDFFDATIMAFGADENDLLVVLSTLLATIPLSDMEKKIALNNYKNALNFYRKHTLFTLLSGVPIPISETETITITSEQWDRFFDTKDYRELLPREEE